MQRIEKYKALILQHMPEQNKSLTKEEHELAEKMYSLLNFRMQQYDLQIQKQKQQLNAKDDEDDFLNLIVNIGKVAVVGAVAFFAPVLLPEALPFVGAIGTLSNSLATGVACGLADASVQGLAVETGAQKHFSFNEMLETSVSFGVGAGLNTVSLIPHTVGVGFASAGTQLVEKAIGTRKDFDAQAVGLQMAASVVARAIGETMPALEKTFGNKNSAVIASTAANTAVNAVLYSAVAGTEPNLKEMSTAVVGALIGHKVGESIVSKNKPEIVKNTLEPEKTILEKPSLALPTKYGIAFHAQNALNPNLKLQVNDLIAQGKWDEAKSFALEKCKLTSKAQKTSFKLGTTKDVLERMQARSTSTKVAMKEYLSPVEEISKLANQQIGNNNSFLDKATPFEKAVVYGLGVGASATLLPEAVIGAASSIATAMTIGPIAEGATIELLANPAFMQAASRAGALLGSGKLINYQGIFEPTKANTIIPVETHPLKGWTVNDVVEYANKLGLKTPTDSLILWTGLGVDGVKLSQNFAIKNGGITLEMTAGGKWLENMGLRSNNSPFTYKETFEIWLRASELAIDQASGQLRSVVGLIRPDSIYNAERSRALMNPKITGLDELNIKPRISFKLR